MIIAALALRRLYRDARDAFRGVAPATRLIVPATVLIAAVLVANHFVPRPAVVVLLFVIDGIVLGVCVRVALTVKRGDAPLEQRLEAALAAYFPFWFARFVAVEITILRHLPIGLKAFISPMPPHASTYVNGSKVMLGAVVLSIALVPDFFFTALIIPAHVWIARVVLDVLELYACAWLFGIFGTMVARPHELHADRIVVKNGIFHSTTIDRRHVTAARTLGIVKRWRLPRTDKASTSVLSTGGIPVVELLLAHPAEVRSIFRATPKPSTTLFVSSDRPEELCRALSAGVTLP